MSENIEAEYEKFIGKKVKKRGIKEVRNNEPKPFKSGSKVNTVTGIIDHPILHIPAFIFVEDDSYVECRRCTLVEGVV